MNRLRFVRGSVRTVPVWRFARFLIMVVLNPKLEPLQTRKPKPSLPNPGNELGVPTNRALRPQKPGTFAFSAQARHVQAPHIRRGEMCQYFGVAAPCEPKNPAHLPFRLKRGTSRHPTYGEARCARFLGWQRLATPKTRHICLFGSSAARPGTPHTERRNVPGFWAGSALRTQKPGTFAFSAQARHVQAPHIRRGEMCQVFGLAAPCEPKNPAHLPFRLKRGTSRQLTYGEAKCARVLGWQRSASPKTWHIYFCGPCGMGIV